MGSGNFEFFGDSFLSLSFGEFSLNEFFVISIGVFGGSFGDSFGFGSDSGVDFSVKSFISFSSQHFGDFGELFLVIFISFFFQRGHIGINMFSEDSVSVGGGIIRGGIGIFEVSRESFGVMGDIKSSIRSSFHGSEDFLSDGGVG